MAGQQTGQYTFQELVALTRRVMQDFDAVEQRP